MRNRVCQLLGCRFPVVEGGLAYVGNGSLAAAVSEAGGFGQIGSGGRTPNDFALQIRKALEITGQPIGVNLPISEHRDPQLYLDVVRQFSSSLRAVSLSAGNPRPLIAPLHDLGLLVITLVSTPEQAVKAELSGADLVVCEGTEAGGHDGPCELTTMTLLPLVVDAVRIPVIAAGGIADGRTAAAAFCLGADAVQLGTRFVASMECQAHPSYKEALMAADAVDAVVIERSLGHVTRVLKSTFVEQIWRQEAETPGNIAHLLPMISGERNALAALHGRLQEGWLNCGQSVGLVKNVIPAGQIVQQIVDEASACLFAKAHQFPATTRE